MCVEIKDYEDIFEDLPRLIRENDWKRVSLGKSWAYSPGTTYAIYSLVPTDRVRFENSPVMLMKAQKNKV